MHFLYIYFKIKQILSCDCHGVKDRAREVNPSDHFVSSSSPNTPQINTLDLKDQLEENISKAKAMVAVALFGGLENCCVFTQHNYISALDDLLSNAMDTWIKLREIYRDI